MNPVLRRIPIIGEWMRHNIEPPAWTGPEDGRRVLIEEEDAELRSAMAAALRDAGFRTAECGGPGHHGDGRCPLVEGDGCGAVGQADAVIQVVVPSDGPMSEVRAAIRANDPDLPVAVMTPAPALAGHPELAEGTTVSTEPLTRRGVVAAVRAALGDT